MNTDLLANNLAVYSLQVGLVIGLAAFVPGLLRLRAPGARLAYWHFLLVACLLLPWLAPKQRQIIVVSAPTGVAAQASVPAGAAAEATPAGRSYSPTDIALALLAAGALARLAWLGIGLLRLRRYRRHATPLAPPLSWSVEADLRLSEDVSSPVTFGFRRPAVLLPANFPKLDPQKQDAILAHECLHVRRRDWLVTLAEECVRAVFWFHPAIWWLLAEIQLAREQAVDRAAVEITNARGEYVDALLAIAGAPPGLDLAPAPLFLRKRHLKKRVVSLLKEVPMSRKRLASALAISLCILAAACWVVTGSLPLTAAPQVVADGTGVTVDAGNALLLHRAAVNYPPEARVAGVQGLVVVEVTLDSSGSVSNMRVLSGPEELRRAVLQSVLQWHFAHDSAGKTRQVTVNFQLPPDAAAPAVAGAPAAIAVVGGSGGPGSANDVRVIRSITLLGIPDSVKPELLAALPFHEGETVNARDIVQKMAPAVKKFDEHLNVSVVLGTQQAGSPVEMQIRIAAPGAPGQAVAVAPRASDGGAVTTSQIIQSPAGSGVLGGILSAAPSAPGAQDSPSNVPQRIRVGGNVQNARLIDQAKPAYPPLAKQARISGTVTLNVIISTDGTVQNMEVVSGHPLLVPPTLDAVRQWRYQPTLLNGNPVEVASQVQVNFALSDDAGQM